MMMPLKVKEKINKMKHNEIGINWFNSALIILSMFVIPLAIDFYIKHFVKEGVFHNVRMHYFIEFFSAFICSLSVYYLSIRFINSGKVRFLFVAIGFSILGLFSFVDGFAAEETRRILWFRAISGFSTAALFLAAAILDEKKLRFGPATLKKMNYFAISSAVIILSIAEISSLYFSTYIPRNILSGLFVGVGTIIIVVCGFAYLASGFLFLWYYKRKADKEYSIFLIVSIILCEKNLIFYRSTAGDLSWWLWHFLQLAAYTLIAAYLMERYSKSISGFVYEIEQRQNAERELLDSQQQLRAANQQLCATEQQLQASNQQLRASEQQLKASNQQLRASEQQLQAANQQLRASEQQLQAANQQLKVNILQLQEETAERKKAEEALRASENKYRTLVENLPQKIFLKDRNSVYVSCNENYARDLKIKPDEITGKADYEFYPKELAEKYRADDRRIMESGKVEEIVEKYIQDGKEVVVQTVKTPVKDEKGNIIGVLGIFWDITERKKEEQQLQAINQQLRASEQQLQAANQQLRASEQQLQAANQQLKANILQLQREITQREQAEEALEESQKRFRAIFDHANDGILLADEETKKFYIGNNTACQMLGYSLEEIKKLGVPDIHPKENLPYVLEQFERQVRREITVAKDLPVKRKDGSVFYADVNSSLVTLAGRTYLLGIFRDVTERKKAEAEFYRVNRALKVISECNQVLVRATDEPNLLNEICRNLAGAGGYRLAWVGLAEDDEAKTVRPAAQAGYEEGYLDNLKVTWADDERGRGPTGTAIRTGKVCISKNIITDPDFLPWRAEAIKRGYASSIALPLIVENRILGALNIYTSEPDAFDKNEVDLLSELANDVAYGIVSLRMRAESQRAQESLKKLSSAVEQTADIVIITNKDGTIEYVNPTFEKTTGYTKEEARGKTPRILKSGKHDQRFYELLWQTVLSGRVFRETLINKKKNNELYYAEKTITPIRDSEGNITHFVSVDKDITERKEIEKTQRLAQLGELVADMAHEVNNPLMIISGNAQLCLMEEIQNEQVMQNLRIIFEESKRAKDIIQRLLKFSRPSRGERKEIDINKTIEAVIGIIEHQFKLSNIEIKRNYLENPPLISADAQQLQEVFMNLLNNARDAMPKGGVIAIATNLKSDFLRLDFKDTGTGMSEEVKKRLFEPFFTTKETGTGLGLAVCYGIIKAHNGELKFESESGKGTIATILLPLSRGG